MMRPSLTALAISIAIVALLAISHSVWAVETHELKGTVVSERGEPIPNVVCTLTGGLLPSEGISVNTDHKGDFSFPGLLPGKYNLSCTAMGYETNTKKDIEVTDVGAPLLQVTLPPTIVVRQKVEVREKAPKVGERVTPSPETIKSSELMDLPLTEQKFKAALPLIPGVVRTPTGKLYIKGEGEARGMLLVDSAETVDPVTGSFSISVPIDAIESINVYKTPYAAEFGRFSGGLTTIRTKPPSSNWRYDVKDFTPDFRGKNGHLVGIADFSPRLDFSGPLLPNKDLSIAEYFEYEVVKKPVRGLAWPHNEIKEQGFTSFTNLQYIFSEHNLLTGNVTVFPLRRQFADIDSLIPQPASSDYGQKGYSIAATDRYMRNSGGILTTLVKFIQFSSNAHGQGPLDMQVTPNGWDGNFFNTWKRDSHQWEILEDYQLAEKKWLGSHSLKVGGDFITRSFDGLSMSRPVILSRLDGTTAEQISFSGPASLSARDTEVALYAQDHWTFNEHLAIDAGLRYSGQTVGESALFGPRFGLAYSPGSKGTTIFRLGAGLFQDRVPLLAADFLHNPVRTRTFFDQQGNPLGPPEVFDFFYSRTNEQGTRIIPSIHRLGSTPYNITWNLQVDHQITPSAMVRLSYVSSHSSQEFVVSPQQFGPDSYSMLLTNRGRSRYHEFEATLRLRPSKHAEMNFAYVYSQARGDLNTLGSIFVPFEQPVIRQNLFADSPSNIPHRLITWAHFEVPWGITINPVLDWHSGYPYSYVNLLQNYVGDPNSHRFPRFLSFDLKLTKIIHIPLIPWVKDHKFRGGLYIFNVTNRPNPRDVYNNIASPYFGHFVGFQHRIYEGNLDTAF